MKEESKPNELILITPSMIRVLEKRHYNPNIAKCQNQTDWLAKLFYEMKMDYSPKIPQTENLATILQLGIKTSDAYKEAVNAIFADTERIVKAMVKEENDALEKSILSGGSVIFFDFIHDDTKIAHTIEEYIYFKCRMSIPYTRRFFIDKDGVLVKTIEPMG